MGWKDAPEVGAQPAWMSAPEVEVTAPEGSRARAQRNSSGILTNAAMNLIPGAVRGAGSIGATLVAPYDIASDAVAGKGLSLDSNRQRRLDMDAALTQLGADPNDPGFKLGKLGAEVAGTLGVGGSIANIAARVPGAAAAAPNLLQAIRTGGMIAGPTAPGVVGGAVNALARATGGAITGGASAGLVNPEQAGAGAMLGGGLPIATKLVGEAGKAIGKGVRSMVGQASPEVAALAKRAREMGIDIPADRLVNSKPLDAVASGLNYLPFSGRAATEAKMAEQLNVAGSKLMGQNTPNMNKALRDAGADLGAKFDATLKNTGVNFDRTLLNDSTAVVNKARDELGDDAFRAIESKFQQLLDKGKNGVIDGQAAYVIKRDLDRIGRGNTPAAYHALELKGVLMDALDRSLGPSEAKAFALTRQQYSNMLALEKLAKNGVEGEISVARLANLKNINNKPLQELADIAAQFVKAREGQHGAMQRAVVGVGAAATGGIPGLVAAGVGGRSVNAMLNSNAARSFVSGQPNALGRLGLSLDPMNQLAYRAAPVLATDR